MLDVYSWKTSNGRKVTVMVEELGVPFDGSRHLQFLLRPQGYPATGG